MITLNINGQYIDLPENVNMEVTMVNGLVNPEDLQLEKTNSFEFPATPRTAKIIGVSHNYNVFIEQKKLKCEVLIRGLSFGVGVLIILECTENIYKAAIVFGEASVDLANKNMKDAPWTNIPLSEFELAKLNANVDALADETPFCFPMVKAPNFAGGTAEPYTVDIYNYYENGSYKDDVPYIPHVFVKYLIEQFLSFFGYRLAGTFFKSELGLRLYYPTNYAIEFARYGDQEFRGRTSSDGVPVQAGFFNVLFEEIEDPLSSYDPSTGIYTIPLEGSYEVTANVVTVVERISGSPVGNRTYVYRVDLSVGGDIIDTKIYVGITNNGNASDIHVSNFHFPLTALDANQVGSDIKVMITIAENENNSQQFKWDPGCSLRIVYVSGDDFSQINQTNFAPNITFGSLIQGLRTFAPLNISVRPDSREIVIDAPFITNNPSTNTHDISEAVFSEYRKQLVETGYTLNYDYSGAEEDLVPLAELNKKGLRLPNVPDPECLSSKDYIYAPHENKIYKGVFNDSTNKYEYQFYAYSIEPLIYGNGENTITPPLTPVFSERLEDSGCLLPVLDYRANSAFFKQGDADFGLQIGIYYGRKQNNDPLNIGTSELKPFGSAANRDPQTSALIFPVSLHYRDDEYGIHLTYLDKMLKLLCLYELHEYNARFPLPWIQKFKAHDYFTVKHIEYIMESLIWKADVGGIAPATINLLRPKNNDTFSGLALSSGGTLNPNPPQTGTIDHTVITKVNDNPVDTEAERNDTISCEFTVTNNTNLQQDGVAQITLVFFDGQGTQHYTTNTQANFSLPVATSDTITLTLDLSTIDGTLATLYNGDFKFSVLFKNISDTANIDYFQAIPTVLFTTFQFWVDGDNLETEKMISFDFLVEHSDGSGINSISNTLGLYRDGNLMIEWSFLDGDLTNITNNFPPSLNININDFFNIISSFTSGETYGAYQLELDLAGLAYEYGWINDGITDNTSDWEFILNASTNIAAPYSESESIAGRTFGLQGNSLDLTIEGTDPRSNFTITPVGAIRHRNPFINKWTLNPDSNLTHGHEGFAYGTHNKLANYVTGNPTGTISQNLPSGLLTPTQAYGMYVDVNNVILGARNLVPLYLYNQNGFRGVSYYTGNIQYDKNGDNSVYGAILSALTNPTSLVNMASTDTFAAIVKINSVSVNNSGTNIPPFTLNYTLISSKETVLETNPFPEIWEYKGAASMINYATPVKELGMLMQLDTSEGLLQFVVMMNTFQI